MKNCLLSFAGFGVRTEFVKAASFNFPLIKIEANLNKDLYLLLLKSQYPPLTSLFAPLESVESKKLILEKNLKNY